MSPDQIAVTLKALSAAFDDTIAELAAVGTAPRAKTLVDKAVAQHGAIGELLYAIDDERKRRSGTLVSAQIAALQKEAS